VAKNNSRSSSNERMKMLDTMKEESSSKPGEGGGKRGPVGPGGTQALRFPGQIGQVRYKFYR